MKYELTKSDVNSMIVNGNVKLFEKTFSGTGPELDLLITRWKKLEKEQLMGIIYRHEYLIESNRITYSILNTIQGLYDLLFHNNSMFDLNTWRKEAQDILPYKNGINYNVSLKNSDVKSIKKINEEVFKTDDDELAVYEDIILDHISDTNELSDAWANQPIKDKIKISISFLFLKWERELDISGIKLPSSWAEFKSIFVTK